MTDLNLEFWVLLILANISFGLSRLSGNGVEILIGFVWLLMSALVLVIQHHGANP